MLDSNFLNIWLERLTDLLVPHLMQGFKNLYQDVKKIHKNNPCKLLQMAMERIPDLAQSKLETDYQIFLKKQDCTDDRLKKMIKAIFAAHAKLDLIGQGANQNIKIKERDLNIPDNITFLHKCYIESARSLWPRPDLFSDKYDSIQMSKNYNLAEEKIKDAVKKTVRKLIPFEQLHYRYLEESISTRGGGKHSDKKKGRLGQILEKDKKAIFDFTETDKESVNLKESLLSEKKSERRKDRPDISSIKMEKKTGATDADSKTKSCDSDETTTLVPVRSKPGKIKLKVAKIPFNSDSEGEENPVVSQQSSGGATEKILPKTQNDDDTVQSSPLDHRLKTEYQLGPKLGIDKLDVIEKDIMSAPADFYLMKTKKNRTVIEEWKKWQQLMPAKTPENLEKMIAHLESEIEATLKEGDDLSTMAISSTSNDEDNTDKTTDDKSADKINKTNDKTDDKTNDKTDDKTDDKTNDKTDDNTADKTNKTDDKTADITDDQPDKITDKSSSDKTNNKVATDKTDDEINESSSFSDSELQLPKRKTKIIKPPVWKLDGANLDNLDNLEKKLDNKKSNKDDEELTTEFISSDSILDRTPESSNNSSVEIKIVPNESSANMTSSSDDESSLELRLPNGSDNDSNQSDNSNQSSQNSPVRSSQASPTRSSHSSLQPSHLRPANRLNHQTVSDLLKQLGLKTHRYDLHL